MFSSHGVPSRSLRGTVVIMAPESTTAFGSSGEILRTWVWVRMSLGCLKRTVIHPYHRGGSDVVSGGVMIAWLVSSCGWSLVVA